MEQQLIDTLKSIGLNKAEVEVYLDLLRYGSSTALDISKRTNLYRSNTYDSLRRLIEKGFIKEIMEDGKRLFSAREPERIEDYFKQKETELKEVIPFLKELTKEEYQERKASTSHGTLSLRSVLNELLVIGKPIYVFAMSSNVEILGEGFMEEFHKRRARKKIPLSMIYFQKNPRIASLNNRPFTEVKYIQCDKDYSTARIFCDDRVFLLTFDKPLTAIEIRSKEIAESFIGTFKFFWDAASTWKEKDLKAVQKIVKKVKG